MRSLSLLAFSATMMAPAASACDLYPTTRPETVSGYWTLADTCLNTPPAPARFDAVAEAEFAAEINGARALEGLHPLEIRTELVPAARFHSLDQIWNGTFGHDGAAGRTQGDRISALDRTLIRSFSAENVARASGDYDPAIVPNLLHNSLMESPGHLKNIMAEKATHMAIGVARVRDGWVVTQLFVGLEGAFTDPVPLQAGGVDSGQLEAHLTGWTLHAVRDGPRRAIDSPPCSVDCPDRLVSTIEVEGRRPAESGRGYHVITLSGPSRDRARETGAIRP
ncbi:MAG: CAP domain-containing protein [Pseudomonadota bacterium]